MRQRRGSGDKLLVPCDHTQSNTRPTAPATPDDVTAWPLMFSAVVPLRTADSTQSYLCVNTLITRLREKFDFVNYHFPDEHRRPLRRC